MEETKEELLKKFDELLRIRKTLLDMEEEFVKDVLEAWFGEKND